MLYGTVVSRIIVAKNFCRDASRHSPLLFFFTWTFAILVLEPCLSKNRLSPILYSSLSSLATSSNGSGSRSKR